jgi:predicted amidohydrolase
MLPFQNRILFVGFGAVARCTLPILLDHVRVAPDKITILEFQPDEQALRPWIERGVNFVRGKVEPGNLGFGVWRGFGGVMGMCICNDRRWPETYRVMGLQGVEMVMLGYNTPFDHTGHPDIDGLTSFHNHLSMQAGAYQNGTWVIGTAKCGTEEGSRMVGQSAIIAPSGEILAQAVSLEDEVITARCDLDLGKRYRETIFNFAKHREPEAYRLIVERKGAIPPPEA